MSKTHILHIAKIEHCDKDGNVLWSDENLDNMLHDEGELYILSAAFAIGLSGYGAPPANLYLGLDTSSRILAETDTLGNVSENSADNGYSRKALSTAGTGLSGQDFYLTQTTTYYEAQSKVCEWTCVNSAWSTVYNLFLATVGSSTNGKLIASVALTASRTLAVGDYIRAAIYIGLSE